MGWDLISTDSQIVAIHAALLPTEPDGVVLYFGDWGASGGIGVQNLTHSRLYRMAPGLAQPIQEIALDALPDTDAFCSGQAFLGDGRLLAAGGTFGWADSTKASTCPTTTASGPAGSTCRVQDDGNASRI